MVHIRTTRAHLAMMKEAAGLSGGTLSAWAVPVLLAAARRKIRRKEGG